MAGVTEIPKSDAMKKFYEAEPYRTVSLRAETVSDDKNLRKVYPEYLQKSAKPSLRWRDRGGYR